MIEMKNKKMKSVFGGIGIAMLLCVLMVLMSWSAMVTNSDIIIPIPHSSKHISHCTDIVHARNPNV